MQLPQERQVGVRLVAFGTANIIKARKKRRSPVNPPAGSYNPVYDAEGRKLQRGYDDLTQDFTRGKTRDQDDLLIALGQLDRSKADALADLGQGKDRNLADLLLNRTRGEEDFKNASLGLDRRYASLRTQQDQTARRAGVESTGILEQAIAARQRNRSLDQAPLDLAHQRNLADSTTAEGRIGEDYSRGVARTGAEAGDRRSALTLAFERLWGTGGDREIDLARAGRDLTAGKLDLSGAKWYEATANGYAPPRPRRRRRTVIG